jgi:hypothetical protein
LGQYKVRSSIAKTLLPNSKYSSTTENGEYLKER